MIEIILPFFAPAISCFSNSILFFNCLSYSVSQLDGSSYLFENSFDSSKNLFLKVEMKSCYVTISFVVQKMVCVYKRLLTTRDRFQIFRFSESEPFSVQYWIQPIVYMYSIYIEEKTVKKLNSASRQACFVVTHSSGKVLIKNPYLGYI